MNIKISSSIPDQPLPKELLDKVSAFVTTLERDYGDDCVIAVTGHGSSQSGEATSSLSHKRHPQPSSR
jgi:hypothetical protein